MPRGDRTGPDFMGPMTGRRGGFCAGYPVPGYDNDSRGGRRGWGRGPGGGNRMDDGFRGHRRWYQTDMFAQRSALTGQEESEILKRQAEYLEGELKAIRSQLSKIETKPDQ